MVRVQVLMTPEEREAFRRVARAEGLSLSGWLRKAGLERLAAAGARERIEEPEQLDEFFSRCDARESGREPDWEEHLKIIRRSREAGQSDT
jgi:hypothetical protein